MLAPKRILHRNVQRGCRVYITIFPDKPITKKPAETRMGSGKGNPEEWVAVVKPGRKQRIQKEMAEEAALEAKWAAEDAAAAKEEN